MHGGGPAKQIATVEGQDGGPGRTRTSNQTVMSEARFRDQPENTDDSDIDQ